MSFSVSNYFHDSQLRDVTSKGKYPLKDMTKFIRFMLGLTNPFDLFLTNASWDYQNWERVHWFNCKASGQIQFSQIILIHLNQQSYWRLVSFAKCIRIFLTHPIKNNLLVGSPSEDEDEEDDLSEVRWKLFLTSCTILADVITYSNKGLRPYNNHFQLNRLSENPKNYKFCKFNVENVNRAFRSGTFEHKKNYWIWS